MSLLTGIFCRQIYTRSPTSKIAKIATPKPKYTSPTLTLADGSEFYTIESDHPIKNDRELPPVVISKNVEKKEKHLTEQDFEDIRRLRSEDPFKYSVSRLAKMFNCSRLAISAYAPAPQSKLQFEIDKRNYELESKRYLARRKELRNLQSSYNSTWTA
jgi:Mitochondrial ribosomal protein subunit L20